MRGLVWIPLLLLSLGAGGARGQDEGADTSVAANPQVAEIIRTYGGRGEMADGSEPAPAGAAMDRFRVEEGLELELVASEPEVTQPLFCSWDSRGRLWVVQYRQYQFPAGLKIVRYDQHLRAVFDAVPEPPPHGVRGADLIRVLEDRDGDGSYETQRDVIEGLNIATSVIAGNGAIWVLNPPYLLRYADADGDAVPEGDPEVRLSGFGLQDTHAVANSLRWGPDGWIYGVQGSTTTSEIRTEPDAEAVEFQGQCVWRYEPERRVFEIYAEGGGNTFSLEIDSGGRVFSGTNNGKTRGMYYPQGSYGAKNWGKHGPLTNPHAFGYFEPMGHEGDDRRFTQAFCIYEGGLLPAAYHGKVIGANSLHNHVLRSALLRDGSTFRTVDETMLLETDDRWFRPVWCGVGPDGGIYVADWYDARLSHVRPVDDWHKGSGRIYRLGVPGGARHVVEDLTALDGMALVERLGHPNKWVRQRAALELGWRGESATRGRLEALVEGPGTIEALWALHGAGWLDEGRLVSWSGHASPDVRRWVVRFAGDARQCGPELAAALRERAEVEPDVEVRAQLAASARRLAAEEGLPILRALLERGEDASDPHLPLLIWWGVEAHAEEWETLAGWLGEASFWNLTLVQETLLSRLMQRYALEADSLDRCAELLVLAPDDAMRDRVMEGFDRAYQGLEMPDLPEALRGALAAYAERGGKSALAVAISQGEQGAIRAGLAMAGDATAPVGARVAVMEALGATGDASVVPGLIRLLRDGEHAIQRVALRELGRFGDPAVTAAILNAYNSSITAAHEVRATADRVLASRESSALALMGEVDAWRIRSEDFSAEVVQQLRLYGSEPMRSLVAKHFGGPEGGSGAEKLAEMARVRAVLASKEAEGDRERGETIYAQRCAACHVLFGLGGIIGPELTGYERGNVEFWLPAVIDPSLEIREGYQTYVVRMKDGRSLLGMMEAQTPETVTLRDMTGQRSVLGRGEMESLEAIPVSLMPEGLFGGLSDGELRDLFAYLAGEA